MAQNEETCLNCGKTSGTKIVCEKCRKGADKYQKKAWDREFQRRACVDANYTCSVSSCKKSFAYHALEAAVKVVYVCADHTLTKGARPKLRYDLTNQTVKCLRCHNLRHTGEIKAVGGVGPRKCKHHASCRFFPARNGYCVTHQPV